VHASIEGIGYVVRGGYELGEARVDVGCGFDARTAALGDGMAEAQRLPEVVVA